MIVEVEKIVYRDREVEKIVYRDREPPEDEGPIKLAKEIKKVQRSAAPGVQRSAAPPPQKSGIIEDTFPLVEFTAAPPQKSGIIEDTFPLAEFNQRSAVPRAQRSAAPLPQKKAAAEEIEDTFPLVEFNQRSAAPRAQRSAAPPPQKKEAVTSSQVNHVHSQACVCIYICHTIVRGRLCIFSKSTYMHTCTTTYAGATGTGAVGVMDQQQLAGCYIHNRTGDHGRSQVHTHIPSTNLYNKQSHSCTLSHVSACASRMSWCKFLVTFTPLMRGREIERAVDVRFVAEQEVRHAVFC
jgi:hypothetical protein